MRVHFIAIGGSVMHQLAIALKKKGYEVTGSDDDIFEPAASNLRNESLLPEAVGWYPDKITEGTDAIILGMHARGDNPELQKALELKIPVYSFPEYIYKESISKKRIAIGGSHGKTTITSMVMHVLKESGLDFDYLVGARLAGFDNSVRITDAPLIVCEADEYPASAIERVPKFHFLYPHIAVISGIAWDHINVFPTFENYCEQFKIFIDKIEPGGVLIYYSEDKVLHDLVEQNKRADIRYIPYNVPDHRNEGGISVVTLDGKDVPLKVFGDHNLLNIQAAAHVCTEAGVAIDDFRKAIATFKGAAKRLESIYESDSTRVYRDFAHAPSKVKATVHAVKAQFTNKKLAAVLELHTYSSLNEAFMKEYKGALDEADVAIVFYSRHALEIKRMPFLEPAKVKSGFSKENLIIATAKGELERALKQIPIENTCFLFMSSGTYESLDILQTLNLTE
ncbi:MAG: peptidoglycan synthetase [Chitinophagaceae bacterium]|nr:peptidoglycan synthetase [Chitinophagaceae bacterium]